MRIFTSLLPSLLLGSSLGLAIQDAEPGQFPFIVSLKVNVIQERISWQFHFGTMIRCKHQF